MVDCLCFSSDYHVQAQRAVSAADRQAAEQALQAPHEVWLGATADSAAGVRLSLIQIRWGAQGRAGPGMATILRLAGGARTSILWIRRLWRTDPNAGAGCCCGSSHNGPRKTRNRVKRDAPSLACPVLRAPLRPA